MDTKITRRKFLEGTTKATLGIGLISRLPIPFLQKKGANDIINIGVVGLNGHGAWAHLENSYLKMKGVRVIALCDPDQAVLDRESKKFYDRNEKVQSYIDIRKLLDNKDIDVISGATPNHWHALSTVWACQAGKDVCVEKPASHTIWEGRKMVEAAKKYNRIVQADLDIRSNPAMSDAIKYIHSGELGKILMAHSWVYKRRKSIGKVNGSGIVPKTVDYNLWCGAAPMVPLPRINLHYDWHWQWDYGNGEIGNNGPHHLDVCRWALGYNDLAPRVISFGGRYGYSDDGQTPNTLVTVLDYQPAPIIFEVRGLPDKSDSDFMDSFRATTKKGVKIYHKADGPGYNHASIIVCEHGYVDLGVEAGGHPTAYDNSGKQIKEFISEGGYSSNQHFIEAVRSRKEEDIRTPILQGHLSAAICHMGNISYRVGKEVSKEEVRDFINKDPEVLDAFERTKEHLFANGVAPDKLAFTLGPWLKMDSVKERFVGPYAEMANKYVRQEYREPFVIRDEV
jgi:predicted dehydrogenase